MSPAPSHPPDPRRAAVRRTALILAAIAVLLFVLSIVEALRESHG